jgi:hypothetical protein
MSNQLISMFKDGETIKVNPICVEEHQQLGWAVLAETEKVEPPADAKTEKKNSAKGDEAKG